MSSTGKSPTAVENSDVVQSEKAALKNVLFFSVLSIHPPGEIEQQLLKNSLQKKRVRSTKHLLLDFVDAPGSPGMHGRIDIAEAPLARGELAVWMHVPFAGKQDQLLLGEVGIDQGQ